MSTMMCILSLCFATLFVFSEKERAKREKDNSLLIGIEAISITFITLSNFASIRPTGEISLIFRPGRCFN